MHRRPHKRSRPSPSRRVLQAAAALAVTLFIVLKLATSDGGSLALSAGSGRRGSRRLGGEVPHAGARQQAPGVPRIPRRFHQVYVSSNWSLPDGVTISSPAELAKHGFPSKTEDMQTWHDVNAPHGFTYHFWDKPAMEALVKERYTKYWEAWQALPKDVERADFARYIVLDHMGGAYADSDVACLRPMSDLFHPGDALVASWEDAFPNEAAAIEWKYGRQAQMVNWFLAAAPGHPALRYVMDAIKATAASRLFADLARDTVERTGPGIWTEAVLHAAFEHPPAQGEWAVRVLPKITAGWDFPAAPKAFMVPAVFLQHNFRGSWQEENPTEEVQTKYAADYMTPLRHELLPTSVPTEPPFTLLHHQRGAGDLYEGADASYSYILYGQWQPGSVISYPLHTVERVLAGLAAASARGSGGVTSQQPPVLLDIGAGYGLFTLAAAARGHPVLAFEAATKSAAALKASIEYNGFSATLVQQVLGDEAGSTCLDDGESLPPTIAESRLHGYNPMKTREAAGGCKAEVQRQVAADAVEAALPKGARIGAVRIAAYGLTKRVILGLERTLQQHKPYMVVLEWRGGGLDAEHEQELALAPTLQWLAQRGWDRVLHTGPVCRKQWGEALEGLRHRWPSGQPLDLEYAAAGECMLPLDRAESSFLFMQEGQTEVLFITRPLHE